MIYVLTTVGTSIISNISRKLEPKFQEWLTNIQKSDEFNIEDPIFSELREKVKVLGGINKNRDYKLSAEITSLLKIKEANEKINSKEQDIRVKFILTDTVAAQVATILLQDFFQNESMFNKESLKDVFKIEGLQVKNFKRFEEEGLLNLINQVNELKQEFDEVKNKKTDSKDTLILNLTGGYKGMIPFLTLFGQLYNIEINYIYEMSEDLIKFPQLPIQFDWLKAESYYNYLSGKIAYDDSDDMFKELENSYLIKTHENNSYTITAVGKLFYEYIKEKVIVDDRVMGHTMEYKLLEYYLDNPYENKYLYLKRSEPLKNPDPKKGSPSDIDLLMKENKDSSEFIAIECKPYLTIEVACDDQSKGFIKQLKLQLDLFKKNNYFPKEYLLHIYVDHEKIITDSIKDNLKCIKDIIAEQTPQINFKAFIFSTGILSNKTKKGTTPYREFMSGKLTEVKEYIGF